MSGNAPFLVETHQPATFRSRGVAAPFTTPLLTGTRVRESKGEIELVIPNPSGGRGVYILDWAAVRTLGHPNVHDTLLFRRLGGVARLDPAAVRDAALDVALDGHAGRDAAAEAKRIIARDAAHRLNAQFLLMIGLIDQVHPAGLKTPTAAENAQDVAHRGTAILHTLAPLFGRSPADLADALAALGNLFASVGVAADDTDARIARLLARLDEARRSLSEWLAADTENDIGGIGRALVGAMQATHGYASTIVQSSRAVRADPIGLLKRWLKDPGSVLVTANRADWVLDGWEWLSLLWLAAETDVARRRALLEMAQLAPVLPGEAGTWTDPPAPPETLRPPCRVTSREDSWRSGAAAFALIERNEILRAMST
nr:hypothetical protein [uncultured Rhodopila sp.]